MNFKRKNLSSPLSLLVSAKKDCPQLKFLENLPANINLKVSHEMDEAIKLIGDFEVYSFWGIDANHSTVPDLLKSGIKNGSELQWIHIPWAGMESILFPELAESPIVITNAAGVYAEDLGEFAIGAMLYFAKDFRGLIKKQEAKIWKQEKVEEIRGKKVGIIGYGGIGRAVGVRAAALGMEVTGIRSNPEPDSAAKVLGLDKLDQVLSKSDYVVIATPLTAGTRNMINKEKIDLLKNNCVLINIGRGAVIDEQSLIQALKNKKIKGAALDVFIEEPLPATSEIYTLDNVLLSPHCADQTDEWQNNSMKFFVENVKRYVEGKELLNVVNKQAGY